MAKDPETTTSVVLPKRWIEERRFAWLGKRQRLAADNEPRSSASKVCKRLAMTGFMLRRLHPAP